MAGRLPCTILSLALPHPLWLSSYPHPHGMAQAA